MSINIQRACSTLFYLQTMGTTRNSVHLHVTNSSTLLPRVTVSMCEQQVSSTLFDPQRSGTMRNSLHLHVRNFLHIVTLRNGVHLCATSQFHFVSSPNARNHAEHCPFTCHKLVPLCFISKQWEPRVTVCICMLQTSSTSWPRVTVSIYVHEVSSTFFDPQTIGTTRNSVHYMQQTCSTLF